MGEFFCALKGLARGPPGGAVLDAGAFVDDADLAGSDSESNVDVMLAKVEPEDVGGAKGVAVGGEHALDFVADGRVEAFV